MSCKGGGDFYPQQIDGKTVGKGQVISAKGAYERSAMNTEVSSEKELLRPSENDSGSGFMLTDKNGVILMSSPSVQRMLSYDFPIKGLNLSEVMKDRISTPSLLFAREGRFIVTGGTGRRIIEYGSEFLQQDDVYFILFRDVTRAEEMENRRVVLEQLSTVKKMARNLSHEIRDPLAVIFAGLQLLETSSALNREDAENLRFVLEAARSVVTVVNKFSEFLMPVEGAPSRINVAKLASECVEHFRASASSKGIHLRRAVGPESCILVHEPAMTRVMAHIIVNALEACRSGDTVTVGHRTLDRRERSSVLPGYAGKVVGIFVEDTGPGLSADLTETSVFRPFVTTKKKSLGLGLSVARDIVEYHGGVISFASRISGATVLEILLPLAALPHSGNMSNTHHVGNCPACEVQSDGNPPFCWAIKGREHRIKTGCWLSECLGCEYFESRNLSLYLK